TNPPSLMVGRAVAIGSVVAVPTHVDLFLNTGTTDWALVAPVSRRNEVGVLRLRQSCLLLDGCCCVDGPSEGIPIRPSARFLPFLIFRIASKQCLARHGIDYPADDIEQHGQGDGHADHRL